MQKISLFIKNIRENNFNISFTIWLSFWYIITCLILIFSQNYLFNSFISSFYNQNEKVTLEKNIQEIIRLIDRRENPSRSPFECLFFEVNDNLFFLVEDVTNRKIMFITPGMFKFLYSLRENITENLVTPDDDINIRSKNSKYFYYIKKEIVHNNKVLHIEVLSDKTNRISILTSFKNRSNFISLAILIFFLILSIFISKIILSPIHRIVKKISIITSSNLHERVDIDWLPQEIKIIKNSFNEVLERLEDSFRRISQFSDDIAHEIRTPVNNLKGEIEVTLQKKRTNQDYIDILHSNLEECHRLTRIIDNLTFLSRSEKQNIRIQAEEINVFKELNNMKDLYEGIAEEKFITISLECDKNITAQVDKVLFQRIISNLLSNAITYNKDHGKIKINAIQKENYLHIEVKDTGVGISEKNIPHLFDRFYRIDKARHTSSKNMGLGLSLVKSMVNMHNGTIEIQSKEGEGTTVIIELPLSHQEGN
ncbi:heavy metal sensor histidine kinase [Pigmentibacter sp. JX0631]|uniref:heavy metal sensor histidine kinase n=1 Tax=Pigmentibacter sp. JX0631 TaxID=2976982 RepID=UPI002468C55B|nr:heavy metal sensor histidine kinase [Pigmentibacter sp. JX0631]WGL59443.1 heavy metal sensor histidine kinase [Pigmentibacter sp. JX0631]